MTVQLAPIVPDLRIEPCNRQSVAADGDYVLYWMTAYRRAGWSFSLDRAVDWARELDKPLVVLEALRSDYPWASDRLHTFVLQGMADNAERFEASRATYYPYVERRSGEGRGLLEAFARRAAVVVTDDFPCFFMPRMVAAAARRISVRLEKVDSNGLLPMRATDRVFRRAVDFRRFLQKTLPEHLGDFPREDPLDAPELAVLDRLPSGVCDRWPKADLDEARRPGFVSRLPIDHSVAPVETSGGASSAREVLARFLDRRLERYQEGRNDVTRRASSELSAHLHFGNIGVHQVFAALVEHQKWDPSQLFHKATASRQGWWGMSEAAESFLDELVTWRELGFNMCSKKSDYDTYESLPEWARETLGIHRSDPREYVYSLEQFESAATHDELWNAAQRELVSDGRIHNYLRMLWGKKVLEWTRTPREALAVMVELNNKYAVDGRDPNSYSGIFWCLGRYDRAWGPERPIFGKIRYMSSDSTRRKLDAKAYVKRYGKSW